MPRMCCIVNCTSANKGYGNRKKTLFKIPKDHKLREKWLNAMHGHIRNQRTCMKNQFICERHFLDSDIVREFQSVVNGNVYGIDRDIIKLKLNAVPCFFDESLSEMSDSTYCTFQHNDNIIIKSEIDSLSSTRQLTDQNSKELVPEEFQINFIETEPIKFMIEEMSRTQNTNSLKIYMEQNGDDILPVRWKHMIVEKGVLFFYLDFRGMGISKTVFVGDDMKVQVRANNQIAHVEVPEKIQTIDEIVNYLRIVTGMQICEELYKENTSCPRLFEPISYGRGMATKRCLSCRVERKRRLDRERKCRLHEMQNLGLTRTNDFKKSCYRLRRNANPIKNEIEKLSSEKEPTEEVFNIKQEEIDLGVEENGNNVFEV